LSIYNPSLDFREFSVETEFEKWAAVEVSQLDAIPKGMKSLSLPGGQYAVFIYKGKASDAGSFFRGIYAGWLPESGYRLDNTRPHFEILGEKYKNEDPESEEEVWIPISK
jgi:AraC family transcriptional regulator